MSRKDRVRDDSSTTDAGTPPDTILQNRHSGTEGILACPSPVTPTTYMVAMVLAPCARPPHSPRCRARHWRLVPDFRRGSAASPRRAHGQALHTRDPGGGNASVRPK